MACQPRCCDPACAGDASKCAEQRTESANEMLSGCKGLIGDKTPPLKEALRQGRCAGYVAGLVYARSVFLCVPEGATPEQGVRVVIKYIEVRPERMHEPFGKLALEALEEAWPCKR